MHKIKNNPISDDDLVNKKYVDNSISTKQDKTDNALDTTDKTVIGAINEINDGLLDNVTFSSDYKNIILNRKGGLNPYTIPIASIIHNAKITEFNDVDDTDIGNGKTLIYDSAIQKHKYVDSTGTDELVKMDSTTDAKYLSELIDKSTVVNDNGVLKIKKLDGQEVTIAEINHLKGLTMNVMDLVNAFSNGGVKVLNTPVNTYADLSTLDRSSFLDGISYIVYVLADETHSGAKTTYLCDKTSETFFGNADSQRNFITDPIDLANEVTGKLGTSNIDVDNLWDLLTINDTYKTLTTNNEPFGTHGAKAMYDELFVDIGKKANTTDLTRHTDDTDIHITSSERTKWNNIDNIIKNNIKTYTTLEQLGLATTTCTIKDIWDKMPVNSIAIIDTNGSIVTDLDVIVTALNITTDTVYGFLTIGKFKERTILEFRRSHTISAIPPEVFIGYCVGSSCTSIQWEKMMLSSIEGANKVTTITFSATTNYKQRSGIELKYYTLNGVCYVSGGVDCVKPSSALAKLATISKPKIGYVYAKGIVVNNTASDNTLLTIYIDGNGSLQFQNGLAGGSYRFTFSYPIA